MSASQEGAALLHPTSELGWLAGFSGHTGFYGVNPYVNVGFPQILNHINVISSFSAEVIYIVINNCAYSGVLLSFRYACNND